MKPTLADWLRDPQHDRLHNMNERASIREMDGRQTREEAERAALAEMEKEYYECYPTQLSFLPR